MRQAAREGASRKKTHEGHPGNLLSNHGPRKGGGGTSTTTLANYWRPRELPGGESGTVWDGQKGICLDCGIGGGWPRLGGGKPGGEGEEEGVLFTPRKKSLRWRKQDHRHRYTGRGGLNVKASDPGWKLERSRVEPPGSSPTSGIRSGSQGGSQGGWKGGVCQNITGT